MKYLVRTVSQIKISVFHQLSYFSFDYITEFSSQRVLLLSGSHYLWIAVAFGRLKMICIVTVVSDKADM